MIKALGIYLHRDTLAKISLGLEGLLLGVCILDLLHWNQYSYTSLHELKNLHCTSIINKTFVLLSTIQFFHKFKGKCLLPVGQSSSVSITLLLVTEVKGGFPEQGLSVNTWSGWRANLLTVIPALVQRPWTTFSEMSAQPEQKWMEFHSINWVNAM